MRSTADTQKARYVVYKHKSTGRYAHALIGGKENTEGELPIVFDPMVTWIRITDVVTTTNNEEDAAIHAAIRNLEQDARQLRLQRLTVIGLISRVKDDAKQRRWLNQLEKLL